MNQLWELIWTLFNSRTFLWAGAVLGAPLTIVLAIMFARKQNRDERGWKIFGKASIVTFVCFLLMVNVIAKVTGRCAGDSVTYLFYANSFQWLYYAMAAVELGAVLILRRLE